MNASALSYPVPPRTALQGLIAAILGLSKDAGPEELSDAMIGLRIRGSSPVRHYHKANVRKRNGILSPISVRLKPANAGITWDETEAWGRGTASQVTQEWLLSPDFVIFVASKDSKRWFQSLVARMTGDQVRSHFTPCLGTAWMTAKLELIKIGDSQPLPKDEHLVETVCRSDEVESPMLRRLLEVKATDGQPIAVQQIRLPRSVTEDRVFSHADYYLEMNGNAVPLTTDHAWSLNGHKIMFL